MAETLEEFKDSFSYGSRNDLSFKFLKKLSPPRAGEAIRQIFGALGAAWDSNDLGEVVELLVRWQVEAYSPAAGAPRSYVFEDTPWTALSRPLAESKVGLLTSSGHFAAGDDPAPFGTAGMTQIEAVRRIDEFMRDTPVLSVIPTDIDRSDLRVRHGGYDIRSAVLDHNVALPRDALVEAASAGRVGSTADVLFSFPGATAQGRLRKRAIPEWINAIKGTGVDVMLLVPV